VLSVDAVGVYKPSPRVYEMAPRALGVEPGEILFVSSNGWDVAGAAAFGFRTCWCNRANAPVEELETAPDYEVDRLDAIADKLGL
jgi:2-haloacid dehalogenase